MKIYKKEDFNYVVSSITGFTDQSSQEIMAKILIGGTTAANTTNVFGIKGTQQLQLLNSTPAFQPGLCGFSASGTTTFTQRSITVQQEKIAEELCPTDLYSTYQSLLLQPGEPEESVPFENKILELKSKQINQRVETKLWQATVAGGDAFDGFAKLISTGTTGVGNSSGTTFSATAAYGTAGNPITEVDKLINALSDDALVLDSLICWMSFANFRLYLQAMTKANFFQNYIGSSSVTSNMEAIHPNTNVKVVPTLGLAGSNQVVIGSKDLMVTGFDLLSDMDNINLWYSKDFDVIKLLARYAYGAQIVTWDATKYFATNNLA